MKIYKTPENVMEAKLDKMFSGRSQTEMESILSCFSIILHQTTTNTDIQELYRVLGLENFTKVLTLFDGKTVNFPTKIQLKDNILLALVYYYREVKQMEWKEIHKLFPFEISSISYSLRIKSLNSFIKKAITDIFDDMDRVSKEEEK